MAQAGDLDAVVNNAAVSVSGPLEAIPLDQIRAVFETNALGPLRVIQPRLGRWRERGSGVIVNVSSVVDDAAVESTIRDVSDLTW